MLHFTRIFFEILILAFVNTVKCPYWIADYMTAALFALNFEEKALVSAVWWWWSELLPPLGKWNILSRPYQKKKKKKPEEVGRSDPTHDPICYLTICYVPLNFCMSEANCVIYHCHTDLLEVSLQFLMDILHFALQLYQCIN